MGVCVYFELNMWAHTAMEDNLLEELLGIANSDALAEFEQQPTPPFAATLPLGVLVGGHGRPQF